MDRPPWHLTTLGRFALEAPTETSPRPTVPAGKGLALITYLTLAPERRATRDELLDLLWSRVPPERARASLRQLVWQIRQSLGDDILLTQGRILALGEAVTTDHESFVSAVAAADRAGALEVYGGPFLRDFSIPGGDEFDDWILGHRQRLLALFRSVAEERVYELITASAPGEATAIARRLVDQDQFNERAWQLLLQCTLLDEDSDAALIVTAEFEAMLRESGREPDPTTSQLMATVQEGKALPLAAHAEWTAPSADEPPWRPGARMVMAAIGMVGLMIWAVSEVFTRPYQIVVTREPLGIFAGDGSLVPTPTVEVRTRTGARVSHYPDSITARVVEPAGRLGGRTVEPVRDGRATFADLRIETMVDSIQIEFSAPRLSSTRSIPLDQTPEHMRLFLVDGQVNGQPVSPAHRTITVAPGARITGTLRLRYTVSNPAATALLGAAPTWGDRTANFLTIFPLTIPARERVVNAVPFDLAGPDEPGTYHLIFTFQLESGVDYVVSGTNLKVGDPVWYDGNDVAEWSRPKIDSANATGHVMNDKIYVTGRYPEVLPATAIEIVVTSGPS